MTLKTVFEQLAEAQDMPKKQALAMATGMVDMVTGILKAGRDQIGIGGRLRWNPQYMARAFCSYLRFSPSRRGNSALELEGQQTAVEEFLQPGDTLLVPPFIEVEVSKNSDRPQLQLALDRCRETGATLLIARLDRLACNVRFISTLIGEGVPFVACDMPNATPFMLHTYASVAEEEARLSRQIKAVWAVAKARDVDLGNARRHRPGKRVVVNVHSLGGAAARLQANYDAQRILPLIESIRGTHAGAIGLQAISRELNAQGVATPRGGLWTATAVRRALARLGLRLPTDGADLHPPTVHVGQTRPLGRR